ncbi:MAG: hypothetical protein E2P02_24355 [Acidobacteria bacterium]|nr:MAG: hypothetical protein E2P02_24355 [Acidobacteriota bacterium]
MAYSEKVAERLRQALKRRRNISERKMFGGIAFLRNGNMCCGVNGTDHAASRKGRRSEGSLGAAYSRNGFHRHAPVHNGVLAPRRLPQRRGPEAMAKASNQLRQDPAAEIAKASQLHLKAF